MTTINILEKDEFTGDLKSFTIDVSEISYIICTYPVKNDDEDKGNRMLPNIQEEESPLLKLVTVRSEDINFGSNPTVYKIGDNEGHIITTPHLRTFEKAYMTLYSFMEEPKEEEEEANGAIEESGKEGVVKEIPEGEAETD